VNAETRERLSADFDRWWDEQVGDSTAWTTLERLAARDAYFAATRAALDASREPDRGIRDAARDVCEWDWGSLRTIPDHVDWRAAVAAVDALQNALDASPEPARAEPVAQVTYPSTDPSEAPWLKWLQPERMSIGDKLYAAPPRPAVSLPEQPPAELLASMAMRYRLDFGLLAERERETVMRQMSQLYEEATGQGFYALDGSNAERYRAMVPARWLDQSPPTEGGQ